MNEKPSFFAALKQRKLVQWALAYVAAAFAFLQGIAALQKLLSIPCYGAMAQNVPLTLALRRIDPMFDPLRNDPRFQKLCEEKSK